MIDLEEEVSTQLVHVALLTLGAAIGALSWGIAGSLTGMLAPTLPLPPGTRLSAAIVFYSGLVYLGALETDDDGNTRIEAALGRLA